MDKWRSKREKRHSTYYANLLYQLNQQYQQGGSDNIESALSDFDNDWTQIRIGQQHAQENASLIKTALALCSDYASNGTNLLSLRQPVYERIAWLQTALDAMRALNFPQLVYGHLSSLSDAYGDIGDFKRAEQLIREALKLTNDDNSRAHLFVKLGTVQDSLGQYHEALNSFSQAFDLHRKTNDLHSEALVLNQRYDVPHKSDSKIA